MNKMFTIMGFIIIVLTGLNGCIEPEVTDYFNKEYEVNEDTILKVTNINGQIEINNWYESTFTFNAIKRSRFGRDELSKGEINVTKFNNEIDIETKYHGSGSIRLTVDMNIKVNDKIEIDTISTSNGAIQISGARGNITAYSSNGAIIIEEVDGYVKTSTSNGRISVKGTKGIKDLETSNGDIYTEILDFKEDINIVTSNGRITVQINSNLNADIEMKTSNGKISISELSLNLTKFEEKNVIGKLGEGGNKILIQTSNGNIDLSEL